MLGARTTGQGYVADATRQKFTGYEADGETGLNFAQARYQSPIQGRFTSVDPLGRSATVLNPQSFNRYSYVLNNPTNLTDPTGMEPYRGADQSWGDVEGGFWGSYYDPNGTHFGGPAIVANGMDYFADRRDEEEEEEEDDSEEESSQQQDPADQTPAGLSVVSVEVLPVCDGQNCGNPTDMPHGISIAVTYQVVDKAGNPIKPAGLVPREQVGKTTIETKTEIATQPPADQTFGPNLSRNSRNTGVTDAKGQFVDAPFTIKAGDPITKASVKQEIYFVVGKQKVFVRTNKMKVTGKFDKKANQHTYTITNGSDINKSIVVPNR